MKTEYQFIIFIIIVIFGTSCEKDGKITTTGTTPPPNVTSGTFTDTRDNRTYKYVEIGDQIWMAENLDYRGDDIRFIPYDENWDNNLQYDGWCYYGYDSINVKTYGVLYQWEAAKIACPNGWHLPTDSEWSDLENYLSENGYSCDGVIGNSYIAKSIAKDTIWNQTENPAGIGSQEFLDYRNKSDFSALPSGYRNEWFKNLRYHGYWWSATETDNNSTDVWIRELGYSSAEVFRIKREKNCGISVRCIKDKFD